MVVRPHIILNIDIPLAVKDSGESSYPVLDDNYYVLVKYQNGLNTRLVDNPSLIAIKLDE